jgi:preprotein translocase subunit SecF
MGDMMAGYRYLIVISLLLILLAPVSVCAECKEYKVVEFEDRIEAVCVGEPLTAAELKAKADEEKRQELEARRQKSEEERRQKDIEVAAAKNKSQEETARKKQEVKPTPTAKSSDRQNNPFGRQ